MSQTEVCHACRAPATEEVCTECFAPLGEFVPRFTHSEVAPLALPTPHLSVGQYKRQQAPPNLREISYQGPSRFSRFMTRSRGSIGSILVGSLLFVGGAYFWIGGQQKQVAQENRQAEVALSKGEYKGALQHYQTSYKLHGLIFDRAGQIQDLIAQSRCLAALKQFDEALLRLQRAAQIEETSDVSTAIGQVHRLIGIQTLAEAKATLDSKLYEKAVTQAESALESLSLGDGAPRQLASAHRVAGLALAHLREGERAGKHLAEARVLEGDSQANRLMAAKISQLAARHKKERQLAFMRERAKEAAALAKARSNRPVASQPPPEMAQHQERGRSYGRTSVHEGLIPDYASYPTQQPRRRRKPVAGFDFDHFTESRGSNYQAPKPNYPTYERPTKSSARVPQSYEPSYQPSVSIPSIPSLQRPGYR